MKQIIPGLEEPTVLYKRWRGARKNYDEMNIIGESFLWSYRNSSGNS